MIHRTDDHREGELCRAIQTLYRQKEAAYGDLATAGDIDSLQQFGKLLVGTGLTATHVAEHALAIALAGGRQYECRVDRVLGDVERESVSGLLAGAWSDGLLVGLKLAEQRAFDERHGRRPPPEPTRAQERARIEALVEADLQRLFPGQRVVIVPWLPGSPPLWTRHSRGVREAERDRRRHPGARRYSPERALTHPFTTGR